MPRQVPVVLRCTLPICVGLRQTKDGSGPAEIYRPARNNTTWHSVDRKAASVADKHHLEGRLLMTIRTRIVLGVSAAALSLGLALMPAAFALDKMGKDEGMMKKDTMSKDGMKKDTMSKDEGMKKDHMSKDGMKKDDGMMKKN
jgi:pentapeptide MXKDX repeat protein